MYVNVSVVQGPPRITTFAAAPLARYPTLAASYHILRTASNYVSSKCTWYNTVMFRPFFLYSTSRGDTITEDGTGLSSSLVVVKKEKVVGCCARKQASRGPLLFGVGFRVLSSARLVSFGQESDPRFDGNRITSFLAGPCFLSVCTKRAAFSRKPHSCNKRCKRSRHKFSSSLAGNNPSSLPDFH